MKKLHLALMILGLSMFLNKNVHAQCNVSSITAVASTCDPDNNYYSVDGQVYFSNPPTTGVLYVYYGSYYHIFYPPFASPITYSIDGLNSSSATGTMNAYFSTTPACSATTNFVVPATCYSIPACSITSLTATPAACNDVNNYYDVTGSVSFINPPSTGQLYITIGSEYRIFTAPFSSPINYMFNGLSSNGTSQTVSAYFTTNTSCASNITFMAPALCDPIPSCIISGIVATASSCDAANNKYSVSGTVSFNNAPNDGVLYIYSGSNYEIHYPPFTSPTSFDLNNFNSSGSTLTISSYFSSNSSCTSSVNISTPATCYTPPVCTMTLLTATPSACDVNSNLYTLNGQLYFNNPPQSGELYIYSGNKYEIFYPPFTSPITYSITGSTSNGSVSTVNSYFSANTSCTISQSSTAPVSCMSSTSCSGTVFNSFTATTSACDFITNEHSVTGNLVFTNAPSTGSVNFIVTNPYGTVLSTSQYNAPFASPLAYTIAGIPSNYTTNYITAIFSTNNCQSYISYTAPAQCIENSPCLITSMNLTPLSCDEATNMHSVNGTLDFDHAPSTGSLIINLTNVYGSSIADALILDPPFIAPITFNIPNIPTDGGTNYVTATFSDMSTCTRYSTYVSPPLCTNAQNACAFTSHSFSTSECNPLNQTYTLDGSITFDNPPNTGSLNILISNVYGYIIAQHDIIDLPISSPYVYSVPNIPVTDGATHYVSFVFSDQPGCTYYDNYVSPPSCGGVATCAVSTITSYPDGCGIIDDLYTRSGTINVNNPPSTGSMLIQYSNASGQIISEQIVDAPFTFPYDYSIDNIPTNGSGGYISVSFSSLPCSNYTYFSNPSNCEVPPSCILNSITYDVSDCDPTNNLYSISGEVSFSNAPSSGELTVSIGTHFYYIPSPFTSPATFVFNNLPSNGSINNITASFSSNTSCALTQNYAAPYTCHELPVCGFNSITAVASACDPTTGKFNVTGTVDFHDAPSSGYLYIYTGSNQEVHAAPFTSPMNFNFDNLVANGTNFTVNTYFSANTGCNEVITLTAPANCDVVDVCQITYLSAEASACDPNNNYYTISGEVSFINPPNSGNLYVYNGTSYETFVAPFTSPITYTLPAMNSVGSSLTVSSYFSANSACAASQVVNVPEPCYTPPTCHLTLLTAVPTACDPTNNLFSVNGQIEFVNPPTSGYLSIYSGSNYQYIYAPFTSPISYTINGLNSNSASNSVSVNFSDNSSCNLTTSFNSPASCFTASSCSASPFLGMTAIPGTCDPVTNYHSVSGVISVSSPPATGSIEIYVTNIYGYQIGSSQIINAPFGSTINYALSNINSYGSTYYVNAIFTSNGCTSYTTYTSPAACVTSSPCSISGITAVPGSCTTPDNVYDLTGTISIINPPSSGGLLLTISNPYGTVLSNQIIDLPISSPYNYTFNDLFSDNTGTHYITATFIGTGCTSYISYAAPSPCVTNNGCQVLSLTAIPTSCDPIDNTHDVSGIIDYANVPSTGYMTIHLSDAYGYTIDDIQTVSLPVTFPYNYTFENVNSVLTSNYVNVSFSDQASCYTYMNYAAPAPCVTYNPCSISSITATPSTCDPATGLFTVNGFVQFTGEPTTGSLTLTVTNVYGYVVSTSVIENPIFSSPLAYTVNGLLSNGLQYYITAQFTDNPGCTNYTYFNSPADCKTECAITYFNATPGSCLLADNTYNVTGTLNFSNPPSTGQLLIYGYGSNPVDTVVIDAPFSTSVTYDAPGGFSNSESVYMAAVFTDYPSCIAYSNVYTEPVMCIDDCIITNFDLNTSSCDVSTNTYSISGIIDFTNDPGDLLYVYLYVGASYYSSQTFTGPFTSPYAFTINDLPSNGLNYTVVANFPNATNTCSSTQYYTAPASCIIVCDITNITTSTSACDPSTNLYSVSGEIEFIDAPSTGTLTVSGVNGETPQVFNAPFTSPISYTLSNGTSNGNASSYVYAEFSASYCPTSSSYFTAPSNCIPACAVTNIEYTVGACNPIDNTYSVSGLIYFENAPYPTNLVITCPGFTTQVILEPFTSPYAFNLTGAQSDGMVGAEITAYFSSQLGCFLVSTPFDAPVKCMPCTITSPGETSLGCYNNGTPSIPSDDTWSFQITPTGTGVGSSFIADFGSITFNQAYGSTVQSPQYLISNGDITYTLTDYVDPSCTMTYTVSPPSSCSDLICDITNVNASGYSCDANIWTLYVNPIVSNFNSTTFDISIPEISYSNTSALGTPLYIEIGDADLYPSVTVIITDPVYNICTESSIVFAPASCTLCSITSVIATASACDNLTNEYSVSGEVSFINPPLTGTLTVTGDDGLSTTVFDAPFVSPISYLLTGGSSDGGTGNMIHFTFSDEPCTQNSLSYTAPAPCVCDGELVVETIGVCNNIDNTFDIVGHLAYTSLPLGTIVTFTDTNGSGNSVTSSINISSSFFNYFAFNDIIADGQLHTITISAPGYYCIQSVSYTSPSACDTCNISSITSIPTICDPASNTYSVSGEINFYHAPSTGTLTINTSDGGTIEYSAPFISPIYYNITDIVSSGDIIQVSASFSEIACVYTAPNAYTAPSPCDQICSVTDITLNVSACNSLDDTYSVSGVVTIENPPSSGFLYISGPDGLETITIAAPFGTSIPYTLTGGYSDGNGGNQIIASFSAIACTMSSTAYNAPSPCTSSCNITDISYVVSTCNPGDNTYSVSGTISVDNPPSTGYLNIIGADGLNSITIPAPFGNSIPFTLIGGMSDGNGGNQITVSFTSTSCWFISSTYIAPSSCTGACDIIDPEISVSTCFDNGTPMDASDDYFNITILPVGYNLGTNYTLTWNNSINTGMITNSYTTPSYINNLLISEGIFYYTITDELDPACTYSSSVVPPITCSDVCPVISVAALEPSPYSCLMGADSITISAYNSLAHNIPTNYEIVYVLGYLNTTGDIVMSQISNTSSFDVSEVGAYYIYALITDTDDVAYTDALSTVIFGSTTVSSFNSFFTDNGGAVCGDIGNSPAYFLIEICGSTGPDMINIDPCICENSSGTAIISETISIIGGTAPYYLIEQSNTNLTTSSTTSISSTFSFNPVSGLPWSITIIDSIGQTATLIGSCTIPPTCYVGIYEATGYIFIDMNDNGIYDLGIDTLLSGIEITLYNDLNGNGLYDSGEPIIGGDVSDINGYGFNGLSNGNYVAVITNNTSVYEVTNGTAAFTIADGNITITSNLTFSEEIVAITDIILYAKADCDMVSIQWNNYNTTEPYTYTLQASQDALTYTDVATTTQTSLQLPLHFFGNYYRLQAWNPITGQKNYSQVTATELHCDQLYSIQKLYPNPTQDEIYIEFLNLIHRHDVIFIYDELGRVVKSLPVQLQTGVQTIPIPTQDLANGIYFIGLQNSNQNKQYYKFVKM